MDQWMDVPYYPRGFIGARAPLGLLLGRCEGVFLVYLSLDTLKFHPCHDVILYVVMS